MLFRPASTATQTASPWSGLSYRVDFLLVDHFLASMRRVIVQMHAVINIPAARLGMCRYSGITVSILVGLWCLLQIVDRFFERCEFGSSQRLKISCALSYAFPDESRRHPWMRKCRRCFFLS